MKILPSVPDELAAEADAALAWFSKEKGAEFKITGVVDDDSSFSTDATRSLQLILCGNLDGQDVCLRESFLVGQADDGAFAVTHVPEEPDISSPAPELDPPAGTRLGWLDRVLADAEFVVLLFYRGLW